MQDVLLNRATRSRYLHGTVGVTATRILPYDPYRWAIAFGQIQTGRVTWGTDSSVIDAQGIMLASGTGTIWLPFLGFGDLVRQEWWAVASAAGTNYSVFEVTIDEDYYRDLEREYSRTRGAIPQLSAPRQSPPPPPLPMTGLAGAGAAYR